MKKTIVLLFIWLISACSAEHSSTSIDIFAEKASIDSTVTAWHKAAADANFDSYFELLADSSIFMGTDATEYWTKSEFMEYSRPYFEKGKAWTFYASIRRIYVDKSGIMAWFDEELVTENMGPCRGSGVLKKVNNAWKIEHYNLSIPIPNDLVRSIVSGIHLYHEPKSPQKQD
jgi:hypothetical protein